MNIILKNQENIALYFVRFALAIAFLSAVADRFGFWGNVGNDGVAWGDFKSFKAYVAYLNPYLSSRLVVAISYFVTIIEVFLAVLLILGRYLKLTALFSFILLLSFAISMSIVSGIKAPLDYSVYTASAAALVLYILVKKEK